MSTFTGTGLKPEILEAIGEMGFETPTPIQALTIPHILTSSDDLVALAQTGTGKTAAFGLPIIHKVDLSKNHVQAMIICPTRELCLQITSDITKYSKFLRGLNVTPVYGGADIMRQIRSLRDGSQIVVGTPGRVTDLLRRGALNLSKIDFMVLDEADEMLNMGFKDDLDFILSDTPSTKQTMLFSATMPHEIRRIAQQYMNNPTEVASSAANIAATNVEHHYYVIHAKDRYETLKRLADFHPDIYGIIFCRTRQDCKHVADKLMGDGYNADALHGDLSQAQRDYVMGRFRSRHLQLLVATDVAARGIDVTDLTHVINYDLPDDSEVYIHRSGRTGRAGKSGISISLVHTREQGRIRDVERMSKKTFIRKQVPGGTDVCKKQLFHFIEKVENVAVDEDRIAEFMPEVMEKLKDLNYEQLLTRFVSAEFNRFLDYYKNARDLNVQMHEPRNARGNDRGDRGGRSDFGRDRNDRAPRLERRNLRSEDRGERGGMRTERFSKTEDDASFTKVYINLGVKQNLSPVKLIGLVNDASDRKKPRIGRIDMMKKFTFFEIEKSAADRLINSLNGRNFEGIELAAHEYVETPNGGALSGDFEMKRKKRR